MKQLVGATHGETELMVASDIEKNIVAQQTRSTCNEVYLFRHRFGITFFGDASQLLFVGRKPLPEIVGPLPQRQMYVAKPDKIQRIAFAGPHPVGHLEMLQCLGVPVHVEEGVTYTEMPSLIVLPLVGHRLKQMVGHLVLFHIVVCTGKQADCFEITLLLWHFLQQIYYAVMVVCIMPKLYQAFQFIVHICGAVCWLIFY